MLLKEADLWMYIFKRTHFRTGREKALRLMNEKADLSDTVTVTRIHFWARGLFFFVCFVFFHLFVLQCKNQSYKHSVGSHGGDDNGRGCRWNHTMPSAFVELTNMSGMLCCQHILDLDCIIFFSYSTFFFSLRKIIILYSGMPNHTVSKDEGLKMSIIQHYYPELYDFMSLK